MRSSDTCGFVKKGGESGSFLGFDAWKEARRTGIETSEGGQQLKYLSSQLRHSKDD